MVGHNGAIVSNPEPQLASQPPLRIFGLRVPAWLRAWWPAFLWATFIFLMSTDTFSAEHTGSIIEPILRWLLPSVTTDQIDAIHHFIRKCAHFTEYFVFGLFLYRAVRKSNTGWRWSWGLGAWIIAAAYSALDEIHQAFVSSRTASPYDSMIDSIGALFAILFLYVYFRLRKPPRPQEAIPEPS
jgi:VanZ family protein